MSYLTHSIWGQACKGGSQYNIFTLLHRKLKLFQNVILLTRNDLKGSLQNQVIIYPGIMISYLVIILRYWMNSHCFQYKPLHYIRLITQYFVLTENVSKYQQQKVYFHQTSTTFYKRNYSQEESGVQMDTLLISPPNDLCFKTYLFTYFV